MSVKYLLHNVCWGEGADCLLAIQIPILCRNLNSGLHPPRLAAGIG